MEKQIEELKSELKASTDREKKLSAELNALKEKVSSLEEINEALELQVSANAEKVSAFTKETAGEYIAKSKKTYRIRKGHLKINFKGEVLLSSEVIQSAEIMEELIKINAGCIELV